MLGKRRVERLLHKISFARFMISLLYQRAIKWKVGPMIGFFTSRPNRPVLGLLVIALVVGGVGAQASGVLNSPSGGYLVCVNSKTKVVTHTCMLFQTV